MLPSVHLPEAKPRARCQGQDSQRGGHPPRPLVASSLLAANTDSLELE